MTLFALASVLVSLAAVPVVMSTSVTPQHTGAVQLDLKRLWRISHTGMLGCFVSGLANGSFWALAAVFTAGVSDDLKLVAGFMTGAIIGGAAGQWPLGIWSDRVDRRIVLAAAALLSALVGLALWWFYAELPPVMLVALGALWGAFAFPLYSIAVAHSNDFAEKGEYVMVSSGLLLSYGVGAIIGPGLAAAAMTWFSDSALYGFTAIVHLALLGYVLYRLGRRASAPMEQHVPFAEALTAVQTASQIYEEEQAERSR